MRIFLLIILLIAVLLPSFALFQPNILTRSSQLTHLTSNLSVTKRSVATTLSSIVTTVFISTFSVGFSTPTIAAESAAVIYKSGKSPAAPNAQSIAPKSDSKKDISFLRCMSNCKAVCQKPNEGLAKVDCNQDCQDQCCNSYEQCSFKIKISTVGAGV